MYDRLLRLTTIRKFLKLPNILLLCWHCTLFLATFRGSDRSDLDGVVLMLWFVFSGKVFIARKWEFSTGDFSVKR